MSAALFNLRIRDDRGREVRLGGLSRAGADDPELEELQIRVVAATQAREGLGRALSGREILLYGGAAILVVAAMLAAATSVSSPWGTAPLVVVCGLVSVVGFREQIVRQRKSAVSVLLDGGRCAACGYPVRGVAAAADGCVVCPECGAAWRAERIRPAPVASVNQDARSRRPSRWRMPVIVRDATDRPVVISDARLTRCGPEVRERLGDQRFDDLRDDLRWIGMLRVITLSIVLSPGLFVWASWIAAGPPSSTFTGYLRGFGRAACAAFMLYCTARGLWMLVANRAAMKPKAVLGRFLDRRVCPHCLTPLEREPIDEQRRIRCPGCEAVWQLPHTCSCGYDLRGVAGVSACPECGRATETL